MSKCAMGGVNPYHEKPADSPNPLLHGAMAAASMSPNDLNVSTRYFRPSDMSLIFLMPCTRRTLFGRSFSSCKPSIAAQQCIARVPVGGLAIPLRTVITILFSNSWKNTFLKGRDLLIGKQNRRKGRKTNIQGDGKTDRVRKGGEGGGIAKLTSLPAS